ncbi:MAG: hypothetical protein WB820_21490, partial [Rhodoplanes sp.]
MTQHRGDIWHIDTGTPPATVLPRLYYLIAGVIGEGSFDPAGYRSGSSLDEIVIGQMLWTRCCTITPTSSVVPRLGLIRQVELACADFNATVGIAVTAFSLTQPHTLRPPASAALLAVAFVFVQIVQIRTARRVRSAGCAARRRPLLGEIEKPQVRGHPFVIHYRPKLILVGGRSVDRETIDRLASLANT